MYFWKFFFTILPILIFNTGKVKDGLLESLILKEEKKDKLIKLQKKLNSIISQDREEIKIPK